MWEEWREHKVDTEGKMGAGGRVRGKKEGKRGTERRNKGKKQGEAKQVGSYQ